jgi:hypothetical protein
MSPLKVRWPLLTRIYSHNPFYAISAVLMLLAVRNAYGELEIGAINCWLMMGVLAAYTSLLAGIGVLIVRKARIWEDARSILLLLLVLFLAVSISADDLFVKMESHTGGTLLLLCGYLFSAVLSEIVLRAMRVRMRAAYRWPYHALLLLFYVAPWWCSPELHPRSTAALEWTILSFPVAAALLILCLVPAVRRGADYVRDNGTPWNWPWFPWTAFGVMIAAVALRTFALCMTFGPSGPIWIYLKGGGRLISFDTMWGPYFLIPPALAVLVLLLEAGITTANRRLVERVLRWCPLLLLLAVPISSGPVFRDFLQDVTQTAGSPLWLTVCLLVAFFGWARLRGEREAERGLAAMLTLLSIVGPRTHGLGTLIEPAAWPFALIGAVALLQGLRRRSSALSTAGVAALAFAVWIILPHTIAAGYRMTISYHVLWVAVIAFGLVFRDRFADVLRIVGALQMPLAAAIVLIGPRAADVPISWRLAYVAALTIACLVIARTWRSRWYLYAFTSLLAMGCYGVAVLGFRSAVQELGRASVTAFAWSAAALLTAFLISAHKARWLPARIFPRWRNGHAPAGSPTNGA